jgi:hypothetical protein
MFIVSSCSQPDAELNNKIKELSFRIDSLSLKIDSVIKRNKAQENEITWIESAIADLAGKKQLKAIPKVPVSKPATIVKPTSEIPVSEQVAPVSQCEAITNSGKRCSKPAVEGSKYCAFHKEIYEPVIPKK